jgi:hypothetical protein
MISRILFAFFLFVIVFDGCKNSPEETGNEPKECTVYSCPLHPDHTSVTPAKCPICNMEMKPGIKKVMRDSLK